MPLRNLRLPVIFVVLFLIAVATASWLGFRNGDGVTLTRVNQGSPGAPGHELAAPAGSKSGILATPIQGTSIAEAPAPAPFGRPMFTAPVWGRPELPPATPEASHASRAVLATATLDVSTMPMLKLLRKGDHVVLPLAADVQIEGVVNGTVANDSGWTQVAGGFANGGRGSFMLSQKVDEPNVWAGHIEQEDLHVGYVISTANARVKMDKKPLSAMICEGLPLALKEEAGAAALDTTTAPAGAAPAAGEDEDEGAAVPVLSSKPYVAGMGVLYLDFDGETVTDPSWNAGVTIFAAPATVNGAAITAAQVTDIWKRVSEDYQPFAVTVTTDLSLYNAAPDGKRMRCIVTPSSSWYTTSVGGITKIDSYGGTGAGFSSTVPCWVFNNTSASTIALTIAHELGHSLGLSHDGTAAVSYYAGHDTGATSWGPIMGAPYGRSVTQWDNGSYPGATNTEDDVSIIAFTAGGASGYAPDEAGSTPGTAAVLATTTPINVSGIISRYSDVDWYRLSAQNGPLSITLKPAAVDPDVDTQIKLYDDTGTLMLTSVTQAGTLASTLSTTLNQGAGFGTYFISVGGKGRARVTLPAPGVIGYSGYGSIGTYTLTGTYVTVPEVPSITIQPLPVTIVNQGAKATLSVTVMSNSPVTYQWYKKTPAVPAGAIMPGKTASTLVFAGAQLTDDATYFVVATNKAPANNVKTSNDAMLAVYHKPAIVAKLTPSPSTVVAGANAQFAVIVTDPGKDAGAGPTFVWKKNNVVIPVGGNASAGTATLQLPAVDFYAGASYTCTVSNSIGFVTSLPAVLTVTSPPLFKVDLLATKHLALGGTATAAVTVVGTAPFTYQWFFQPVAGVAAPITGATKAIYAWSAIKATAAGEYWVVATGKPGGVATSATSTHMVVDVQEKPVIALAGQPPATASRNAGDTLTLTCTATGTATLLYQWQFNGVNLVNSGAISGADTATLTINPLAYLNKGTYRCIVTNAVGTVTSRNTVLTVISPPVITIQPVDTKIATGGTGVLKVVAVGTPTLKYLWLKDTGGGFATVPGGTGPTLTLGRATATATLPATPTAGDYKVVVTNLQSPGGIGVTSTIVHVTVFPAPKIVTQPQAKLLSGIGKSEQFKVVASGGGTLTYQWQKNNKDIAGQTTDTLVFASLVLTDAGTYRCIVKNEVGTATSLGGVLSVLIAPSITVQPQPVNAYIGSTFSFPVVAAGSAPLTYQWEKDNGLGVFVAILATSAVAGTTVSTTAKTPALKLVNVKATDAGNYRVVITNPTGTVTSNVVVLTTQPVPLPIINDFTPHKSRLTTVLGVSKVPMQIIMAGQFFNFVTKVRFVTTPNAVNGIPASFVLNGHNEMVISIPGNITVPSFIELTDASGVATTTTAFTPVPDSVPINDSAVQPNDDLINAVPLMRSLTRGMIFAPMSDNTRATLEPGEFSPWRGHTVWYHWRPATTALYDIDTVGCSFDSTLSLFRGPNVPTNGMSDLSLIIRDDDGAGNARDARVEVNVIKGQDYYIAIDSFGTSGVNSSAYGTTALTMYTIYAGEKVDVDPVIDPLTGETTTTTTTGADLPFSVGGSAQESEGGESDVSVAWLPTYASPPGSVVTAKANLSIDTTIGTPELFSWSVYDRSGAPVFALTFDAATGQVLSQADGQDAEPAGQAFLPNTTYQLTLEADYARGVWGASLNGVTIIEDQPLSEAVIKSGFGDVGAVWVPAPGATTGGTMHYGDFSVSATRPEGK